MICGLVEQENVGLVDERFDNREALSPTAGESSSFDVEFGDSGATENFRGTASAIQLRHTCAVEGVVDDVANRLPGSKFGDLADQAEPGTFADGNVARVGRSSATQDIEQCRFAGAVRTDDADPRAIRNDERHVLEKWSHAEPFR